MSVICTCRAPLVWNDVLDDFVHRHTEDCAVTVDVAADVWETLEADPAFSEGIADGIAQLDAGQRVRLGDVS